MMPHKNPDYSVGQYLTIYCGADEGCCFWVRARRWALADAWRPAGWEYDTGAYGWRRENTISTEAHARFFA